MVLFEDFITRIKSIINNNKCHKCQIFVQDHAFGISTVVKGMLSCHRKTRVAGRSATLHVDYKAAN